MDKLLELAGKAADEAEVYRYGTNNASLSIENGTVSEIGGSLQDGYALRIIKKRVLGTSYSNNLVNRKAVVEGALTSLIGKVKVGYEFPEPSKYKKAEFFSRKAENVTYSDLFETGLDVMNYLDGKVKGQLNVYLGFKMDSKRIINGNGLDCSSRSSYVYHHIQTLYPKTTIGLSHSSVHPGPYKVSEKELQEHLDLYNATIPEVEVNTGSYPTIFLPHGLFPVIWRISEGANGRNIYKKTSPLTKKLGKKVFSEDISIIDDPLDPRSVGVTAFDDEGVPTSRRELFKNGVFKTCYADLDYASKLKMKPTGNGFRDEIFMSGNPIRIQPNPILKNLTVACGKDRYRDMVASMDKGIIVDNVIGPHSGNILNGDFSVGLSPGFFVRKGEIVGRVKDALISGNIYDLLKKVSGIEDRPLDPPSVRLVAAMGRGDLDGVDRLLDLRHLLFRGLRQLLCHPGLEPEAPRRHSDHRRGDESDRRAEGSPDHTAGRHRHRSPG